MKYFSWLIIIGFLVGIFFLQKPEIKKPISSTLKIGTTTLNIEVADTDIKRIKGLSGREGLAENSGLLFVFEKEGYQQFWMKDMKFPIDMAWLDKNKKIIHIESNVSPETYPKTFTSQTPALFVLETPANFFTSHQIPIGTQAEF
jgi:uncharacterized membrane protein (UPF0127 family)